MPQGFYGWIARHEVFFYIFDTLMMLGWLGVMVPLHFGVYLQRLRNQLAAAGRPRSSPQHQKKQQPSKADRNGGAGIDLAAIARAYDGEQDV